MHEASIASELIGAAEQEVRRAKAEGLAEEKGRVQRVKVLVGRLSGASAEALRFAFDAMRAGTLLETAELEIEQPLLTGDCRKCGVRSQFEEAFSPCPQCGSYDIYIEKGRELLLTSIEID
ncbi:MAG: hydrogenase maturation nickel metallochaperone HypA [Candidatus Sumerlaeota bacterium]|nr:hydrogenase maturation nickel metallochaperone HypA [Candidatus Sumerlaeota bacterium]